MGIQPGTLCFDSSRGMKNALLNVLLTRVSTLLMLIVLEAGVRVFTGDYFSTRNFREQKIALFRSAYPAAFDATLGWIPKAGFNSQENIWRTQVTILPDGVRANGPSPGAEAANRRPILAVGDSFTFGDQVSDDETWPAQLERLSGVPVINGGVFGYGIDQSYLRAQHLTERFQPRAQEQGQYNRLFDGHMTAAGNRLAAEEVFSVLRNTGILNAP